MRSYLYLLRKEGSSVNIKVIVIFGKAKGFYPIFLSDPSPIIGYACHSLTNWLTDCCLVNLIDVTLACEDANSKLVEVVTVADVDAEKCVDDILVPNWKLKFGHKVKFWFRLWAHGLVKILGSGEILKRKFG